MKSQSWVQNGFKWKKCPGPSREQHFYWRIRARRRGPKGQMHPKVSQNCHLWLHVAYMCFSKMCFPPRVRSRFFKKWQKFERKGIVKHEKQKENSRSHTTFTKLQSLCRRSFLQTGLGGEKRTRLQPQTVFGGGKERTHSEANEQRSDKSERKLQEWLS